MNSSDGQNGTGSEVEPCDVGDPTQFFFLPMVYSMVLCVGLPGNAIALVVFFHNGKIKKAIRIYLINLTISDILFNLTLPLWIYYYFRGGDWPALNGSVVSEILCRLSGATYYLATYSAITFMTLISINRYYTIEMSKSRLLLNTRQGALAISLATWLVWLCCALPSLLEQQSFQNNLSVTKCFEQYSDSEGYCYATIVYTVASFLIVLASYISIIKSLSSPQSRSRSAHRRLAKAMVLGMLLVFLICIAPYHLTIAAWLVNRPSSPVCRSPSTLDVMHRINVALLSLNSCIDPVIYCFSVKRFRTDLLKMWRKILRWLPLQDHVLEVQESHIKSSSFTST
ncbi:platelet-activating factor receptor-like [Ambystoma mexicanum]|uniref:platelet-activating factor receptor-like n=1 Tax=Ambystoma mexicanum TaxID=8296 RepID=UPI0037E8B216